MSAKKILLLRERDYLLGKVNQVQREHAETMGRLRMAEHALLVTELEVERRASMHLQQQNSACEDLRHKIDVIRTINASDERRLGLSKRDLHHAHVLYAEERAYVDRLWSQISTMLESLRVCIEDAHTEACEAHPEELAGLAHDMQLARFAWAGTAAQLDRWTTCAVAERYEKCAFEQHVLSQAIDKLRALEDERGRIVSAFVRASEQATAEYRQTVDDAGTAAGSPVLHTIIAEGGAPPSFADRARRLAAQRSSGSDPSTALLLRAELSCSPNFSAAEYTHGGHRMGNGAEADDQSSDEARLTQPSPQQRSRPTVYSVKPSAVPSPGARAPEPDTSSKQQARPSIASSPPPLLSWHGRQVAIPAHRYL